jgi:galacturonosyltransferase
MKNKKKKLVAVFTNNDDDIYCFRKELVEAVIDEGYDVLISCPYGEKFELMQHIEYIYDNPVIDRRGTNIVADIKLFLHYFFLIKKYRPDVVLTYTAKPNVYGAMAAHFFKIPVISNVTGFGSVLKKGSFVQKFVMNLFKFSYRQAECVMFQNETNMKIALETGMVKGKIKLIPGSGVNTERFPLQKYPDGGNGIDGEKVVFNYVGRILEDKGVEDYIAAAKIIKKKYSNTEFNMLGFIEETEAHYYEDLDNLEKKKIIKFHGSQKDTKPFIKTSHAIIHPSTYGEGMSNVLLESASSGRPIISTDNPGCKETFIDEETGFMYHGGDVDELVEKIEKFLSLPNEKRKEMGEKGREYIKNNFSRDIVIDAYIKKIKELI